MIPKIIHQVWVGNVLNIPNQHAAWSEAIIAMNPTWEFRFHVVNDDDLKRRFWSPASQSNFIRLQVIQEHGGIYLDMDCEPLKPLDSLVGHSAFGAEQDPGRICNAVFGAEPNHPWINWQLHRGAGIHDPHDAAWGVYTMSEAPRIDVAVLPSHLVYPWSYDTPKSQQKPHPESIIAHHWAGSWCKK